MSDDAKLAFAALTLVALGAFFGFLFGSDVGYVRGRISHRREVCHANHGAFVDGVCVQRDAIVRMR